MKWIQHMTNSRRDPKLRAIIRQFGAVGYAVFWMSIEIISENLDKNTDCIIEHDLDDLADEMGIQDKATIQAVLDGLVAKGLFTKNGEKYQNKKVLQYADEWTSRKLRSNSRESTETLVLRREGKGREVKGSEDKAREVKAKPSSATPPNPQIKILTDWWFTNYPHGKAIINGGQDGTRIRAFLTAGNTPEDFKALAQAGWASPDKFVREACARGISGFVSVSGQIKAQGGKPAKDFSQYNRVDARATS